MKSLVVIFVILGLASVAVATISPKVAADMFEAFKFTYNKHYSLGEEKMRFLIFQQNLKKMEVLNKMQKTAKFGVNKFSDLTAQEMKKYTGSPSAGATYSQSCLANGAFTDIHDLPQALPSCNWTASNLISPIKDQQSCGSCWAFATAGSLETAYAIKVSGKPISLSEEQIISCSTGCCWEMYQGQNVSVCNGGCNGGWPWSALNDIMQWGGLVTEDAFPYTGEAIACPGTWPGALNVPLDAKKPYTCLSTNNGAPADEGKMATWVSTQGPVAIALDATTLQSYSSGILTNDGCSTQALDHAVLIVGYNDNNNPPYWIVRNSWGESWGEAGYFRIVKDVGACGLNQAVVAPNLQGNPTSKLVCPTF